MNRLLGYVFFFLSLIILGLFYACADNEETPYEVKEGDVVPEFILNMFNGETFDTTRDIDKTTLIVFFHTACPDCRKELPVLQQLYDSIGQNIHFLLISRQESKLEIETFWKENGLTMPFYPQEDRTIYNKFASSGIPRGYIVDKNRNIRYLFNDINMPNFNELRNQIDKTYEQN